MSPLTRRGLLVLGAVGAGAVATGGTGLWWTATDRRRYVGGRSGGGGETLTEPQVLTSQDRVLEVELTAGPARVQVGGREASVLAFNGSLPGSTWRVAPGDTIRVALSNDLPTPTNLHVHGLQVSPGGNGDNPFVSIEPGASFDYEFTLPDDHPPGTYWYHPHHHGHVADQVAGGLYGAIVVADPDPLPVTRERVLVISDLSLDASGNLAGVDQMQRMLGREGEVVLVDGQVRPRLDAAPGERERWRIVNACPSRYLRLRLDGQQVRLLSRDLGRLPVPEVVSEVVMAPGNRVELLVETTEGTSALVTAPVDRGGMGAMMGGATTGDLVELLTLAVSGGAVGALEPVPDGPALRDLRAEPVAAARTLTFSMGMAGGMGGGSMMGGDDSQDRPTMAFTIDGRAFDHDRVDTSVLVGTVEEWTLVNTSLMDHPVHLHVWPMQVVHDGTRDVPEARWQDVVNVPARTQVTVLVAFDATPGRTVYHCHILDHEDQGMMGTIEVGSP